ncbi:HTH-type transcriptional regulator SarZ [Isoptericola dokdonensis DS-3]|jgi:DNA-binding MarR family transcriptional regulator|uniref:HTH-type transcriptional regulator SarZ n=1 Tax=Isoptericola dokdonensis DS-3 TaxID=1300344 RepID=A0A168EN92_9MICO|nr:HTH-type transcriptional regulator SarZ [Isoptericola dokdonensis DS-3]
MVCNGVWVPDSGASRALDPLLCFAVYSLERRITRLYAELLAPWRLSYLQYVVVTALGGNAGAGLTVGELGRVLDLDSGTLSPLLKRLEARDVVRRDRSAGDERVVVVTLTDAGRALHDELGDVQRCLAERMPPDPQGAAELRERLRAANDFLARHAEPGVTGRREEPAR